MEARALYKYDALKADELSFAQNSILKVHSDNIYSFFLFKFQIK